MNDEKLAEKNKLDADIVKFLAKGGEIKFEPIQVRTLKQHTQSGKQSFKHPIQND